MCHSPQNTDPYSGNPLDFKQMIHKIHTGINLPSINPPALAAQDTTPTLGQGYWIVGYMESLNNFNTVLFPQDTRNCQTCHVQNLAGATEAANYASVPTAEACGACHDNVNFATGANHSTNIVANDTQCVTCHGPGSNLDNGQLQVVAAHVIPDVVAATRYQFNVNTRDLLGSGRQHLSGGQYLGHGSDEQQSALQPPDRARRSSVTASWPTSRSAGRSPRSARRPGVHGAARLAIDIGWDTSDYTNWGSAAAPAAGSWGQPVSVNPLVPGAGGVPARLFSLDARLWRRFAYRRRRRRARCMVRSPTAASRSSGAALPAPPAAQCPPGSGTACAPIQNVVAVLEGHPGVVTTAAGPAADRVGVTTAVGYGNTTGATPVPRRTIVDIAKCDVCHSVLQLHGNNRNDNPQACVVCHNPASTDVSQRQGAGGPGSRRAVGADD